MQCMKCFDSCMSWIRSNPLKYKFNTENICHRTCLFSTRVPSMLSFMFLKFFCSSRTKGGRMEFCFCRSKIKTKRQITRIPPQTVFGRAGPINLLDRIHQPVWCFIADELGLIDVSADRSPGSRHRNVKMFCLREFRGRVNIDREPCVQCVLFVHVFINTGSFSFIWRGQSTLSNIGVNHTKYGEVKIKEIKEKEPETDE